jgi:hypothetical protein
VLAVLVEPITSLAQAERQVLLVAALVELVLKVAVVAVVEAFLLALQALVALAGPERKFLSQQAGLRVLVVAEPVAVPTPQRLARR